jgi:hypothetical protein
MWVKVSISPPYELSSSPITVTHTTPIAFFDDINPGGGTADGEWKTARWIDNCLDLLLHHLGEATRRRVPCL